MSPERSSVAFRPAHYANRLAAGLALLTLLPFAGCSIRQLAINSLADALAAGGGVYASDDDPELIRGALPFSLKLIEGLIAESPRNDKLLLAACSGFTQYAYAFVQQDADEAEGRDVAASTALRIRACRLYRRARDYGLRGLDVRHAGFSATVRRDSKSAVERLRKPDVPLLYWTAAAWGAMIANSKDDPETIADQLVVEAMIDHALHLDPTFDSGAIHSFLISYESARQGASQPPPVRIRPHFVRAVELSDGLSASPFVAMAESVAVQQQDRAEFEQLLQRALQIDVNARPEWRLLNLVMQRRARWLLSRADDLFVD